VDGWEVGGVDADELVESAEGFVLLPRVVAPEQRGQTRRGVPPEDWVSRFSAGQLT
jgi:aconitase A